MKKIFLLLTYIVIFLGLTSCFTTGIASIKPENAKEQLGDFELPSKPQSGKAMVYIVKRLEQRALDKYGKVLYHIDSRENNPVHFDIKKDSFGYFSFEVEPGKHTLIVDTKVVSDFLEQQEPVSISFNAKEGEIVFIEKRTKLVKANITQTKFVVELTPLAANVVGKYYVKMIEAKKKKK